MECHLCSLLGDLMKKLAFPPVLFLFCLSLFYLASVQAQAQNLLANPGFEDPYVASGDIPPREVAEGWNRWHVPRPADAPLYINSEPEYYAAAPDTDRIRSGDNAQLILSLYATHTGGLYQTVSGITVGAQLRFSVYAYVWSTRFDEVEISEEDGNVLVSVGIDPEGGTDGESPNIIWSDPIEVYDGYNEYSVEAVAQNTSITVFIRTAIGNPVKHNYIYVDDAALEVAANGATPDPETGTEEPTQEATDSIVVPAATETEIPTLEPVEEATEILNESTPEPTTTEDTSDAGIIVPGETATLEAEATATEDIQPLPTATLIPSPEITEEAQPTVDSPATETEEAPVVIDTPTETLTTPQEPLATATVIPTVTLFVPTVTPVESTPVTPDAAGGGPISAEFPNTVVYTVQRGDTVARLAQRYDSSIEAIRQANGLDSSYLIFVGQELIIPVRTAPVLTSTPIMAVTPTPSGPGDDTLIYTVQIGDSLYSIAQRFNTTVGTITQLNGIVSGSRLQVGQQLRLPRSSSSAPPVQPPTLYIVRPGDTLYRIALQSGVPVWRIAQFNGITQPNLIYVGQRILIP